MKAFIDIGGTETLSLTGALLVYRGKSRAFATWHEARPAPRGGALLLAEAQELTIQFVQELAGSLGTRVPAEILPPQMLVRSAEATVWWTPGAIRPMFFASHDERAARLNARRFPHPALVWKLAGKDLWVRALADNRRPRANTDLMVAPYWNVDGETAWVCQGTMRSPSDLSVGAITLWESAFFQSEFTHHSGARRLTTHPGGFHGLWNSLADRRRRFPTGHLAPANETLQQFVFRE